MGNLVATPTSTVLLGCIYRGAVYAGYDGQYAHENVCVRLCESYEKCARKENKTFNIFECKKRVTMKPNWKHEISDQATEREWRRKSRIEMVKPYIYVNVKYNICELLFTFSFAFYFILSIGLCIRIWENAAKKTVLNDDTRVYTCACVCVWWSIFLYFRDTYGKKRRLWTRTR